MSLRHDISISRRPFAGMVAIGAVWGTFSAVIPAMKAQIGASDAMFGALMLAASFGAVMAMWLAPLTRRWFGYVALLIASLTMASGFAIVSFAPGVLWFAIAMFIAASGTGVADVLVNAEISDSEAGTGRALMNLNHAVYSFSFAGCAVLSGLARDAGASNIAILTCVAAFVLALGGAMWVAPRYHATETPSENRSGIPVVLVMLGGGIALTAFLTESAAEGWSALHLERSFSADPTQSALGPALFGVMMGLGRLSGHWLARLMPDIQLIGLAMAVSAIGFVVAGLAPTLWLAWLGFSFAGLGISVVVPLAFALVGRSVPPEHRLNAMSRAAAMGYGAFFVGPPAMGVIAQYYGLPVAFCVLALLLVSVALAILPAFTRQTRAG